MNTWQDINSEWIASASFDPQTQTLTIKTKSGKEYATEGVSQQTFDEFMASPSKGAFWNQNIKSK